MMMAKKAIIMAAVTVQLKVSNVLPWKMWVTCGMCSIFSLRCMTEDVMVEDARMRKIAEACSALASLPVGQIRRQY